MADIVMIAPMHFCKFGPLHHIFNSFGLYKCCRTYNFLSFDVLCNFVWRV